MGAAPAYAAVAATARLFKTAVPTDEPTFMAVLAVAAATPAYRGSTPLVATLMAGVKIRALPTPSSTSAGRITARYDESGVSVVSRARPTGGGDDARRPLTSGVQAGGCRTTWAVVPTRSPTTPSTSITASERLSCRTVARQMRSAPIGIARV